MTHPRRLHQTLTMGELVDAAFDRAARVTDNPIVASAIATRLVRSVLAAADHGLRTGPEIRMAAAG